jgi:hypothetical protein
MGVDETLVHDRIIVLALCVVVCGLYSRFNRTHIILQSLESLSCVCIHHLERLEDLFVGFEQHKYLHGLEALLIFDWI